MFYAQSLCAAEAGQADCAAIALVLAKLKYVPNKDVAVESKKRKSNVPLPLTDVAVESSGEPLPLTDVADFEEMEESFKTFKSLSMEFQARLKWKRKTG